ncbi:hypothetical protein HG531_007377 [Fusarium graminearum]|nr:hypothetical protein HG531_007377 [Fusarium graminearum]
MKLTHPLPEKGSRSNNNDRPAQLFAVVKSSDESYQLYRLSKPHFIADDATNVLFVKFCKPLNTRFLITEERWMNIARELQAIAEVIIWKVWCRLEPFFLLLVALIAISRPHCLAARHRRHAIHCQTLQARNPQTGYVPFAHLTDFVIQLGNLLLDISGLVNIAVGDPFEILLLLVQLKLKPVLGLLQFCYTVFVLLILGFIQGSVGLQCDITFQIILVSDGAGQIPQGVFLVEAFGIWLLLLAFVL